LGYELSILCLILGLDTQFYRVGKSRGGFEGAIAMWAFDGGFGHVGG